VETVISALWPNEIFPYALWEMAYRPCWQDAAHHNAMFYKARKISSFPGFDPPEQQTPPLPIYHDRSVSFFRELAAVIFALDSREGFNRLIKWTHEKIDSHFQADIEYFFNGLSRIESARNFGIHRPFIRETIITEKIFKAAFEDKAIFIAILKL
jgi:hypothetical protein